MRACVVAALALLAELADDVERIEKRHLDLARQLSGPRRASRSTRWNAAGSVGATADCATRARSGAAVLDIAEALRITARRDVVGARLDEVGGTLFELTRH